MKYIAASLIAALFFASPSRAETPCDFKGISVGNKMVPAEIMAALGVTRYKMNPARRSVSDQSMALALKKYGLIGATEVEEWEIGPSCDETSCIVPYGVSVGNNNSIPVKVIISFHEGLITEIIVSFSESSWEELVPIFDEKYGADWTVERSDMLITNYETKQSRTVQRIYLDHATNGTNRSAKSHCKIWATNYDIVFEHHDALGPYHSRIVIQLISRNF